MDKKITPYKAVKQHCKYCMNGSTQEVKLCPDADCYWYEWRNKKQPGSTLKAIRKYCVEECCCKEDSDYYERVKNCDIKDCPLYPFRMGKNPYKKKLSEEEKIKLSNHMERMRKIKSKL